MKTTKIRMFIVLISLLFLGSIIGYSNLTAKGQPKETFSNSVKPSNPTNPTNVTNSTNPVNSTKEVSFDKEINKEETNSAATSNPTNSTTEAKTTTSTNSIQTKTTSTKQTTSITTTTVNFNNDIEKFIYNKKLTSKTKYLVYVDLKSRPQKTYILKKDSNGIFKVIKSFNCAGGKPETPTLTGQFEVGIKGSWFFSQKYQQGGMYYTQFKGNYLFHSFPMDQNKNIVDYTVGVPASHGCIRLAVEDAKWIYNYIPTGTKVYIPYSY